MYSVRRPEKITREFFGTQIEEAFSDDIGELDFTQCPIFSTTSQTYLASLF